MEKLARKCTHLICCLVMTVLYSCEKNDSVKTGGVTSDEFLLPRKEFRAAWVATVSNIDWPTNAAKGNADKMKREYEDYLNLYSKANLNAVIFQVRPTADAFFKSDLEPWSQSLTGKQGENPGFDVMRYLIDETHKRGLQFHAWINPFRLSNSVKQVFADNHIIRKHPEWKMEYGGKLYFNPGIPECREFFFKVIDEILSKYNVDGIHFDDYFYPYPVAGETIPDIETFTRYNDGSFKSIEDWRRDNVNRVIKGVYDRVSEKSGMVFGVSPFPTWRHRSQDPQGSQTSGLTCYDDLYADTKKWCDEGWVHYMCPQLYGSTENASIKFPELLLWWSKNIGKSNLIVGMPMYKFGVPAEGAIFQTTKEFQKQFELCRLISNYKGSIQYNSSALKANRLGITDELIAQNVSKTLIPAFNNNTKKPVKPQLLRKESTLYWNHNPDLRYAVYLFEKHENKKVGSLLDFVENDFYTITKKGEYGVTAVSKYNVESDISNTIVF